MKPRRLHSATIFSIERVMRQVSFLKTKYMLSRHHQSGGGL
jgi:hypothetical protein